MENNTKLHECASQAFHKAPSLSLSLSLWQALDHCAPVQQVQKRFAIIRKEINGFGAANVGLSLFE